MHLQTTLAQKSTKFIETETRGVKTWILTTTKTVHGSERGSIIGVICTINARVLQQRQTYCLSEWCRLIRSAVAADLVDVVVGCVDDRVPVELLLSTAALVREPARLVLLRLLLVSGLAGALLLFVRAASICCCSLGLFSSEEEASAGLWESLDLARSWVVVADLSKSRAALFLQVVELMEFTVCAQICEMC